MAQQQLLQSCGAAVVQKTAAGMQATQGGGVVALKHILETAQTHIVCLRRREQGWWMAGGASTATVEQPLAPLRRWCEASGGRTMRAGWSMQ